MQALKKVLSGKGCNTSGGIEDGPAGDDWACWEKLTEAVVISRRRGEYWNNG